MTSNPELITFFAAMLPFVELKLAIPLGRELGLSTTTTFLFATSGSLLPAALMLALLGPVSEFCRKHSKFLEKFLTNLFSKTRNEHRTKFKKYGTLFLILFVAIPLPGSGSATGALIAFIFGVDYWKAITLIFVGTAIAASLLLMGINSVFAILNLFT